MQPPRPAPSVSMSMSMSISMSMFRSLSNVNVRAQALLQAMREEQLDSLKQIADGVQQVEKTKHRSLLFCASGNVCRLLSDTFSSALCSSLHKREHNSRPISDPIRRELASKAFVSEHIHVGSTILSTLPCNAMSISPGFSLWVWRKINSGKANHVFYPLAPPPRNQHLCQVGVPLTAMYAYVLFVTRFGMKLCAFPRL